MRLKLLYLAVFYLIYAAVLRLACGLDDWSFPPGFKFGTASASYQIEGAWNVSDKAESIWDRFVHTRPEAIADGSTGDVACDSYHQWEKDIEIFSLSWSRLLPNGFDNKVSEDGVRYYNNLINGLLAKDIEPLVTLYHFDLPQKLQDLGGWTNPLIADWFADYARVCYSLFGDRVTNWLTINEPVVICDYVYNTGEFPPGHVDMEVSPYLCNRNLLLAHAKAYWVFDEEFRPHYSGQISVVNNIIWVAPVLPEHRELADLANENMIGRYSHPIYSKKGGWPPVLQQAFEAKRIEQGYQRSKLPEFTQEEIEFIKGTADFYAVNYYTSRLVRPAFPDEELDPSPLIDFLEFRGKFEKDPSWRNSHLSVLPIYPEGLRHSLAWLKRQYGDIPFIITENGYTSKGGLEDPGRSDFYREHLEQILLSIKEDGVNVTGYTVWSLMDDFEWGSGYSAQFGLYQVDFTSPARPRTPRASAAFYSKIIQQHSLN